MNIALLLYHHVNELELVGPYHALHTARRYLEDEAGKAPEDGAPADGTPEDGAAGEGAAGGEDATEDAAGEAPFSLFTVAKSRNSVETSGGLIVTPHWAFASAPPPDVLVVPGGAGWQGASRDRAVVGFIREHAPRLRFLVGVGTGVLLLGELGFLRDLRATTSLAQRERLRDYEVGEISNARVVKNEGGLWCAGGVTAGIDAGLELALELYGRELAERVAAQFDYPVWP